MAHVSNKECWCRGTGVRRDLPGSPVCNFCRPEELAKSVTCKDPTWCGTLCLGGHSEDVDHGPSFVQSGTGRPTTTRCWCRQECLDAARSR